MVPVVMSKNIAEPKQHSINATGAINIILGNFSSGLFILVTYKTDDIIKGIIC